MCKEVGRITERPINEGESFSWEGQQFVIPPLPPSYLAGCNIIDIRYILQVRIYCFTRGWLSCYSRGNTPLLYVFFCKCVCVCAYVFSVYVCVYVYAYACVHTCAFP